MGRPGPADRRHSPAAVGAGAVHALWSPPTQRRAPGRGRGLPRDGISTATPPASGTPSPIVDGRAELLVIRWYPAEATVRQSHRSVARVGESMVPRAARGQVGQVRRASLRPGSLVVRLGPARRAVAAG